MNIQANSINRESRRQRKGLLLPHRSSNLQRQKWKGEKSTCGMTGWKKCRVTKPCTINNDTRHVEHTRWCLRLLCSAQRGQLWLPPLSCDLVFHKFPIQAKRGEGRRCCVSTLWGPGAACWWPSHWRYYCDVMRTFQAWNIFWDVQEDEVLAAILRSSPDRAWLKGLEYALDSCRLCLNKTCCRVLCTCLSCPPPGCWLVPDYWMDFLQIWSRHA